MKAFLGQQ